MIGLDRPFAIPPVLAWPVVVCAVVVVGLASGCTGGIKQEHAALMAENERLRVDIAAMRGEIDALRRAPTHLYAEAVRIRQQQRHRDARNAFAGLMEQYPTSPEAQEARDRIAELDQALQDVARQRQERNELRKAKAAKKLAQEEAPDPDPAPVDTSCG